MVLIDPSYLFMRLHTYSLRCKQNFNLLHYIEVESVCKENKSVHRSTGWRG